MELLDTRASARARAWAAIGLDALFLIGPVVMAKAGGSTSRDLIPLFDGRCLTWSLWAPLLFLIFSLAPLLLAITADRWQERDVQRLVDVSRIVAVVVTISWMFVAIVVAYLDYQSCIID
jgi:hypothetical protein